MQTQPSIDGNALSEAIDKQEQGFRILQSGDQRVGAQRVTLSLDALEQLIATEKTRPGRKIILWVSPAGPSSTACATSSPPASSNRHSTPSSGSPPGSARPA